MTQYSRLVSAEQTCHTIEIREVATDKTGVANTRATWWPFSMVPTTAATIRSSPPSSSIVSLKSQRVLLVEQNPYTAFGRFFSAINSVIFPNHRYRSKDE